MVTHEQISPTHRRCSWRESWQVLPPLPSLSPHTQKIVTRLQSGNRTVEEGIGRKNYRNACSRDRDLQMPPCEFMIMTCSLKHRGTQLLITGGGNPQHCGDSNRSDSDNTSPPPDAKSTGAGKVEDWVKFLVISPSAMAVGGVIGDFD